MWPFNKEDVLPEGVTQDEDSRLFKDGVELDANFEPKREGVIYGADNLPMPDEEVEKMGLKQGEVGLPVKEPEPTDGHEVVHGAASVTAGKVPVSFTETRQDAEGKDYTYQYPEIRRDGHLLTYILDFGHNPEQHLVNCLFDDGTTKHVSVEDLKNSGITFNF